ncbi:uncharacterized protein K460DRAFT_368554 [Cucurbitaria berberidis CBS 394.84]|uniref:Mid2 domain-containing protein n=1 Tax=Cucurbitaria berberidis CBS 394.84 TaxID=1168544 RepID=A0A9P4L6W1_9PLEO|nr:uncharacterized protein K460DRAFT_368554 [Cucurbitaria berberidis CBS 394.84]KAF1843694.1 hypothetical protein K460DRAFT_368554 [Cucurbitaria berberidis CBS 394.84]
MFPQLSGASPWQHDGAHFSWRILFSALLILPGPISGAETYSDASCNAVTSTMMSCARRWDAIRTECTKTVNTNTVWPGPCECSYYANDLPCFDEQAPCADQVWTQVPQWFRDGVTSCLMKNENYTIRAQLGTVDNPFLMTGVAGNATRVSVATARGASSTQTAQTGGTVPIPTASSTSTTDLDRSSKSAAASTSGLSTGAKAGIGVGISVGVLIVVAIVVLILKRRRAQTSRKVGGDESRGAELPDEDAKIHEIEVAAYSKHELAGHQGQRNWAEFRGKK